MSSIRINLLPHREQKRQARQRQFFTLMISLAVLGLAVIALVHGILAAQIERQESRNRALKVEIAKLDEQIKDIAALRAEIASLTARQKAVEDLQIDRNLPVHLLNELVKQTPEGIYFTAVKQDGQVLAVTGIAQTQERVSELLRNTAYNSQWLVRPELVESKAMTLTAANKEQKRLFDFTLRLSVNRPQDKPIMVPVVAPAPAKPASGAAPKPASAPAAKKA